MAPLVESSADAMPDMTLQARALGDPHNSTSHMFITTEQGNILQILALVFSAISVASSVLAFYWFIKMRRSFRHDLIMLLIQSDMFKALWFMVYPIVTFVNGPISSHSAFCQVNGFFLAVGIEASDFSVLMIAVHSALYIFQPKSAGGEGGLYPYRHYAYGIYTLLPPLLAALAFVNSNDAYVSDGTYCYLPVRPFWYRLALSWIPRYLIFIIILGIYASIYFYVRYKFQGFAGHGRQIPNNDTSLDGTRPSRPERRHSVPVTPPLACHGLIPVSRHTSANDMDAGKNSVSMEEARHKDSLARRGSVHQFMLLASFTNRVQPQLPTPPSELSVADSDSFIGPLTPHPLPQYSDASQVSPRSAQSLESVSPSRSRNTSWRDPFVSRLSPPLSGGPTEKPSVVDIFSILRRRPGDTDTSTPISQLRLTTSRGEGVADVELLQTRDKIRRQLRFLFIYPLVYIGMWVFPFVSHVMQYKDKYAVNPPFGLTCFTTICVCMQAAVDCWLFSTREKPWRHIPDTKGGFWESLKFWTGWKGVSKRKVVRGPGRSREEMVKEARSAYRRRDEEIAHRRSQKVEAAAAGAAGENSVQKPERSWWDATGLDRPSEKVHQSMSPVVEEHDPLVDDDLKRKPHGVDANPDLEDDSTLMTSRTNASKEMEEGTSAIHRDRASSYGQSEGRRP